MSEKIEAPHLFPGMDEEKNEDEEGYSLKPEEIEPVRQVQGKPATPAERGMCQYCEDVGTCTYCKRGRAGLKAKK